MSQNQQKAIFDNSIMRTIIGMLTDQSQTIILTFAQFLLLPVVVFGSHLWTIMFATSQFVMWYQEMFNYASNWAPWFTNNGGWTWYYIGSPLSRMMEYKNCLAFDTMVLMLLTSLVVYPLMSKVFKGDMIMSSCFLHGLPRLFVQAYLRWYLRSAGTVTGKFFTVIGLNSQDIYTKFWHELPFYIVDFVCVMVVHVCLIPAAVELHPVVAKYVEDCAKQMKLKSDLVEAANIVAPDVTLPVTPRVTDDHGDLPRKTDIKTDSVLKSTFEFKPLDFSDVKPFPKDKPLTSQSFPSVNNAEVENIFNTHPYNPSGSNFSFFGKDFNATPFQSMSPLPKFPVLQKKPEVQAVDMEKREDVQVNKDGKEEKVVIEVVKKQSAWYKCHQYILKFRGSDVDLAESTVKTLYHEAHKWCEDRHMQPDQVNECVEKALLFLVRSEAKRVKVLQVIKLLAVKGPQTNA
jgi:hypothetical protein